jgi:photosystem II stability/assembly factor-like uncharacterized protein
VTAVAFARKDPIAEKHAEGRTQAHATLSAPFLSRTAAGYWDTLAISTADLELDEVFTFPGGLIWIGGFVISTNEDVALKSTDNGATWATYSLSGFTFSNGYALAPRSANVALAATWIGDIYRTTDGGTNWNLVFNYGGGSGFFDGIIFTGGDSVMAVGDADASGLCVVKSTDAGATWTRFTNLPATEASPGSYSSSATYHQMMDGIGPNVWITAYLGGGSAPRLLRTTDFGTTWNSGDVLLTGGLSNAYTIRSFNMVDLNVGWLVPRQTAAGVRSYVHKTTDGGTTWSDTILIQSGAVVKAIKPERGTNNLLGCGYTGNDPNAWWSSDGGTTWAAIHPTATGDGSDLQNASFVNNQLGYVVGVMKALKFIPPGSVDVKPQPANAPLSYGLDQNYPNPFNPTTTIQYSIPLSGKVSLKVYNVLGDEVATLVEGVLPVGSHSVSFSAASLPSGIYFYRLEAGKFVEVRKMALVK